MWFLRDAKSLLSLNGVSSPNKFNSSVFSMWRSNQKKTTPNFDSANLEDYNNLEKEEATSLPSRSRCFTLQKLPLPLRVWTIFQTFIGVLDFSSETKDSQEDRPFSFMISGALPRKRPTLPKFCAAGNLLKIPVSFLSLLNSFLTSRIIPWERLWWTGWGFWNSVIHHFNYHISENS